MVHITRMHSGKALKMAAKNWVKIRSLFIKWTKPTRVLQLHTLRTRQLFVNPPQVSFYSHVFSFGDGRFDTKLHGGTLRECTATTTLKMATNNLVERRSFLIVWTKPPRVLHLFPRIWKLLLISWLPDSMGASTLKMAAFFWAENRSFKII